MRTTRFQTVLGLCAFVALAGCGDDDGDSGAGADAAVGIDSSVVGPDAAAGTPDAAGPDAAAAACGSAIAPVADITGTEGIAIAPDGTIYYSQSQAIGRWVPGGVPDDSYVDLPGASTVWGLALAGDGVLYVASPSQTGRVYAIDTTAATPSPTIVRANAGQPNGLIVGPDGALYYSDFGGNRVYRLDTGGDRTEVTASTIASPNGLLFDDDGTLLVLSYSSGQIHRLTLDTAKVETGRETFTSISGTNPDGIGRDDAGRYYVTDNQAGGGDALIRLDSNLANPEGLLTGIGSAANVAFGRGALDCNHVYVTSSGAMRVFEGDTPGVP